MKMRKYAIVLFAIGVLMMPLAVHAWSLSDSIPIVKCGGSGQQPCTPCSLFETFKRAIDFVLYGITGPIAAFMIVLSGLMMLTGGASPAMYSTGRKYFTNTLIGVTVILLAWAGTNFLIKSIEKGNTYDAWNEFTCPAYLSGITQGYTEVTPGPQQTYVNVTLPFCRM